MQLVGHKGLNSVKELPKNQGILNDDPKEVLEFLTPFHVYDGRKSNFLQKTTEREKETFKHSGNYAETVPLLKIFTSKN